MTTRGGAADRGGSRRAWPQIGIAGQPIKLDRFVVSWRKVPGLVQRTGLGGWAESGSPDRISARPEVACLKDFLTHNPIRGDSGWGAPSEERRWPPLTPGNYCRVTPAGGVGRKCVGCGMLLLNSPLKAARGQGAVGGKNPPSRVSASPSRVVGPLSSVIP
jgi:hypothetical protein